MDITKESVPAQVETNKLQELSSLFSNELAEQVHQSSKTSNRNSQMSLTQHRESLTGNLLFFRSHPKYLRFSGKWNASFCQYSKGNLSVKFLFCSIQITIPEVRWSIIHSSTVNLFSAVHLSDYHLLNY